MIAIVKYNAGNIMSVGNALSRLGYESMITDNRKELLSAEKVILPRCWGGWFGNELSKRERYG